MRVGLEMAFISEGFLGGVWPDFTLLRFNVTLV